MRNERPEKFTTPGLAMLKSCIRMTIPLTTNSITATARNPAIGSSVGGGPKHCRAVEVMREDTTYEVRHVQVKA